MIEIKPHLFVIASMLQTSRTKTTIDQLAEGPD